MVLTEFDEEKYLKMMREEERADGHASGLKEGHAAGLKEGHASGLLDGLLNILSDLGEIPEEVVIRARELDADGIKQWSKLAFQVKSMEEFLQKIGI